MGKRGGQQRRRAGRLGAGQRRACFGNRASAITALQPQIRQRQADLRGAAPVIRCLDQCLFEQGRRRYQVVFPELTELDQRVGPLRSRRRRSTSRSRDAIAALVSPARASCRAASRRRCRDRAWSWSGVSDAASSNSSAAVAGAPRPAADSAAASSSAPPAPTGPAAGQRPVPGPFLWPPDHPRRGRMQLPLAGRRDGASHGRGEQRVREPEPAGVRFKHARQYGAVQCRGA